MERLNEMLNLGMIERAEKHRSRATGILAYHYKVKVQPNSTVIRAQNGDITPVSRSSFAIASTWLSSSQ